MNFYQKFSISAYNAFSYSISFYGFSFALHIMYIDILFCYMFIQKPICL